jgi:glycosyltransferase A (GT-A) superfamily protein (DUF2064 family)
VSARALVVAKAPVVGRAKTRLGREVGMAAAADLAAAALLDTIAACATAFGDRCHLALAGDLDVASRGEEIRGALRGWHVFPQRGGTLGERLADAHRRVAGGEPVVQVGMDTPQLDPVVLAEAGERAGQGGVLGPAVDGGWWLLGLADPRTAHVLADVPMSTGSTGRDTRLAFAAIGLELGPVRVLRDVDTVADAEIVAAAAPGSRFAATWAALGEAVA